jgi:hypothetical protein
LAAVDDGEYLRLGDEPRRQLVPSRGLVVPGPFHLRPAGLAEERIDLLLGDDLRWLGVDPVELAGAQLP